MAVECSTARLAIFAASFALLAISRIEAPICSAPAATVWTFWFTWSAAAATTPACALVSSVPAATSAFAVASSSAAAATVAAVSMTPAIVARRFSCASSKEADIWPSSSRLRISTVWVRSPVAMVSSATLTLLIADVTRRVTRTATVIATPAPARKPTTSARIVRRTSS